MPKKEKFSRRHGFATAPVKVAIRNEAPPGLRFAIAQSAREAGLKPSSIRDVICGVFRVPPSSYNWSEYPNIWEEVVGLLEDAKWYKVYDAIEALFARLGSRQSDAQAGFQRDINETFEDLGIGWKLNKGVVEARGSETFEHSLESARDALDEDGLDVAAREVHEALADLSRRPTPDLTGAIQHVVAGLECVAREVTGKKKATLGKIIRELGLPVPVAEALGKIWGYSSEFARHVREDRELEQAEVELVVGVASSAIVYLVAKQSE